MPAMGSLLDNIIWNCLSGPHAHFAAGSGAVRRYAPGFSPIVGCEDPHHPDFATLANYCEPGESFYVDIWSGAEPRGWRIDKEARMIKMIWDAPAPAEDAAPDATLLKPENAAQAVELTRLTNPGPFGIRTPELGEYFGYFESGQLIALAGERMCAGDVARSERHLHTSGLPGSRAGEEAHAETGAPPAAARQDALPARHGPQCAGPCAIREAGLPRLPRDSS